MEEILNRQIVISKISNAYRILLITFLVVFILYIVFITNGSQNVYLHLIYIPIILSSYFWGGRAGLLVAVISGLLAGPLMPLDVAHGIMQDTSNWVVRIIILTIIGGVTGNLFTRVDKLNDEVRKRDLINPITGLSNTNKMLLDLKARIDNKENFTVMSIKLTNIEGIEKYVNHTIVNIIIKKLIDDLKHGCERDSLYSSSNSEIILLACPDCEYLEKALRTIDMYSSAVKVEDYSVRVSLKAGIYFHQHGLENPIEIYNKARIAYEQGGEHESGVYYYNDELENQRKETFEIAGSLHDALINREFYLVYQPKIDILNNTIAGVEILLRWDRGNRTPVGPSKFIKIAEEIGLVKEISKYVIENVTDQIIEWNIKEIKTNYAINITAKELLDPDFIEWTKKVIDEKDLDRSLFEIEITERVISEEGPKLLEILKLLHEKGYRVSIDDFGTGYNSLMSAGEIPFDMLKIDKYFIDRIDRIEIRELVRCIVNYAHGLNKVVLAEGVETKEQLKYLVEMGCDRVQGYYFCKPLLPKEFERYYLEFQHSSEQFT